MKVTIKPANSYELLVDGVSLGVFSRTGVLEGITAFTSPSGTLLAAGDDPSVNLFAEIFGSANHPELGDELTLDVIRLSQPLAILVETKGEL